MNAIKGWKTYLVGLLMVVGPTVIDSITKIDWNKAVGVKYAWLASGIAMILLRKVTNTPPAV